MQREVTEPLYLDLEIPAGASFAQALPPAHNAFVYVYRGALQIGDTDVPGAANGDTRERRRSDGVVLKQARGDAALLIAGKPLGEPIAQYGPFVMNTNDEIFQAVQDYQSGSSPQRRNGDPAWRSASPSSREDHHGVPNHDQVRGRKAVRCGHTSPARAGHLKRVPNVQD
jgi:hypothetical protein